jgi:hypothetical protein
LLTKKDLVVVESVVNKLTEISFVSCVSKFALKQIREDCVAPIILSLF